MELLFSVYDNLKSFLSFVFQQFFLSKKSFDRHSNIDWVTGHWGKGKYGCKSQWHRQCNWMIAAFVVILSSSKIILGKYWEMAASGVIFQSTFPDLTFVSVKATSNECLKKQDVSLGLKLSLEYQSSLWTDACFSASFLLSPKGPWAAYPICWCLFLLIKIFHVEKKSHCFPRASVSISWQTLKYRH